MHILCQLGLHNWKKEKYNNVRIRYCRNCERQEMFEGDSFGAMGADWIQTSIDPKKIIDRRIDYLH